MRFPRSASRALSLVVPLLVAPLASADEPAAKSPAPAAPAKVDAPKAKAPAKPRRGKQGKNAKKRDVKGPVANFPGFRMLEGGASRVSVEISQKVDVTEHKAEGRIAYRMKGASVPTKTNRLPLETMFFQTPVGRVQLVELDDGDVDLVIELRQASSATYKLAESEGGFVLEVDFPKPSAAIAPPPVPTGPVKSKKQRADDGDEEKPAASDLRYHQTQGM